MAADGQSLYSVLTREAVRDKMMAQINQVAEIFSLSRSDATVILMRLRWNSDQALDRLADNKDKFLAELGLVRVPITKQEESNSCSADLDGDDLVSTPFCSHKFPKALWRDYLSKAIVGNREAIITCLNQDCVAAVGPDTVAKLPDEVIMMYDSFLLGSFMERNKDFLKWCPAADCDLAIELSDEADGSGELNVVCCCGYMFCWKCSLELHRPVACKDAKIWLEKLLNHARDLFWISENTKPCPHCNSPVWKGDIASEVRMVTCICSCEFCWVCSRSEAEHKGKWKCADKVVARPPLDPKKAADDADLIHYLNLWDSGNESTALAKAEIIHMVRYQIPLIKAVCDLSEQDIKTILQAYMLIYQCRQVLKWSCVSEYFTTMHQSHKTEFVNHLHMKACSTLTRYKETLEGFIKESIASGSLISFFSHKVETLTRTTGNYFHGYVKSLEEGSADVKVGGYGNPNGSLWFCGCCMFQNSWLDEVCKVCHVPLASTASTSGEANNNNNGDTHREEGDPNLPNKQVVREEEEIKREKVE